jgi:glycosyltransferase involved in cell wall biosynthesis
VKVLFISRKFPPSVGGMELFAYDLAGALAGKVDLKLVKWGGRGRLKAVLIALPYLFVRSFLTLMTNKIDVIHVQDGVLAPAGYVLSRLFRKPFTVVIHGLEATYQNPLFKAFVPAAVRRADVVFCISSATAAEVKKLGVADSKIQFIPLAVADKLYGKADKETLRRQLGLSPETPIILTVGRLVKRKGVAWFVDHVLPDLVKKYPRLIYVVVGEGSYRPAIEAAIKRQKLGDHVKLLGRVDDDIYEAAYNGADVFVMPNINVPDDMEGFGLVLLEAALCALPVVAADTEGIKDAIADGKNGRLAPAEDAAGFQAAISGFLDEPAAARQFGRHSREFTLENYQWSSLAGRYIEQYRKLIKR